MGNFDDLDPDWIRDKIIQLRNDDYNWTSVGRFFGISRRRIRLYVRRAGLEDPVRYLEDNEATRELIASYISQRPHAGEKVTMAYLRGKGWHIRRDLLRQLVSELDPEGKLDRIPTGKTPRVKYNAHGPGYIWHVDTWHKLGLTCGIVVVCSRPYYYIQIFSNLDRPLRLTNLD